MRNNWIKRIFNSIFTKLLLVLIVAGFCINLSVTSFIRHEHQTNEPAMRNSIINHLNYVVKDLGDPPDLERAKEIAQEALIQIRYQSPDLNWSTSESLSLSPQMKLRVSRNHPNVLIGENRGRHIFVVDQGRGRFIFELGHEFNWTAVNVEAVGRLVALLTAILAGTYLLIRRVLNPVRALTEGVREVSQGNLDHRVRLRRSDELGELARAFNAMTERLRNMLRAKEQLLLDVSHELRSPLTRMKVALESLAESSAKKNIREDVEEMEKMVTEVLQTARSHFTHGQLNLQSVNLVDLLKGVASTFEGRLPRIRMGPIPDRVELNLDPARVKTVLKNVLDNAVKYSFKTSQPVEISMEFRHPYWMIQIRDHGVGIPEDELPYIFEPFYRVDKSRSKDTGGYGLGLSLCKTVMEAHQGKIEVESSPDRGTAVSLFFLFNNQAGY
jgi:signal transduction histidine kinase